MPTNDINTAKSELFTGDLPWNQRKVDDLGPSIMKYMEDHEPFYAKWAETWFNNFQFIYGNQGVKWSRRYGYSLNTDFLQRLPAMNSKAQTNISRTIAEALSAMIYANLPDWIVETCDKSSTNGKRFQRIIQKLLDAYMVRLCGDVELGNAAMIYTVYGMVGHDIGWNRSGGQLLQIPKWQKTNAPVFTDYMAPNAATMGQLNVPIQELDQMGNPQFEQRWMPVLDAMGKQIIDKIFAGDVSWDVLTPFEFRRNVGSPGMHKARDIQRILLLDYDEFLDRHKFTAGATKYFKQVQPIYSNPAAYKLAVRHFMRMQFTTPPGLNEVYSRGESIYKSTMFRNKVMLVEYYDRPHPVKWPMGRKVVVCNGMATHVTVPDYNTGKLDGWHPFVESQWLTVPPSSLSAGPMNDVVAKNRELNVMDSLYATSIRRNMGSQLLLKTGSGFDAQRFTGEPGLIHEVPDPFAARWLHDDMPLSPVLPQLRDSTKQDIYESTGAGDALRGERSPNASSGYAQRIIEEREEKRLAPPRKKFAKGASSVGEKIFFCLKTNVIQLDEGVMGFLQRAGAGEFQPQDVITLLTAPINFGTEVTVDSDSMHLMSEATQQATMADLASNNAAVQARLQNNPGVLDNFLDKFGAEELRDKSAAHRDRANLENEQFSDLLRIGPQALGGGEPLVILQDDDSIHMDEHDDFLVKNADEIFKNPAFLQQLLTHIERHRTQAQEKQGQLQQGANLAVPQMMQGATQQPAPTVTTIQQDSMIKAQQAQQQQQQQQTVAPPKGGKAAAPTSPAPMGSGGPKQQLTSTPSARQPAGIQQGAKPQ